MVKMYVNLTFKKKKKKHSTSIFFYIFRSSLPFYISLRFSIEELPANKKMYVLYIPIHPRMALLLFNHACCRKVDRPWRCYIFQQEKFDHISQILSYFHYPDNPISRSLLHCPNIIQQLLLTSPFSTHWKDTMSCVSHEFPPCRSAFRELTNPQTNFWWTWKMQDFSLKMHPFKIKPHLNEYYCTSPSHIWSLSRNMCMSRT